MTAFSMGQTAVERTSAVDKIMMGQVKWFSSTRGYGFVVSDECSEDILVHRIALSQVGILRLPEGAGIEFVAEPGQRGIQVSEILALDFRTARPFLQSAESSETVRQDRLAIAGPFEQVTVKWFDWTNGYGFVNQVAENTPDVFIHADTIRSSGLLAFNPGDRFEARIASGPKGKTVVSIKPTEE